MLLATRSAPTCCCCLRSLPLLLCVALLRAAEPGNVTVASTTADSVTLASAADRVLVRVLEPNLLQVQYRPADHASPTTLIVDPGFATRTWSPGTVTIADGASEVTLTTTAMVVRIAKSPCRIAIYQTDGTTRIFGEPAAGGMSDTRVKVDYDAGLAWYGIQSAPSTRGRDIGFTTTADYVSKTFVTSLTRQNVTPAVDLNARWQGSQTGPFAWTTGAAGKPGFGLLWDNDGGSVVFTDTTLEMNKTNERGVSAVSTTKLDTLWFAMVGTPSEIAQAMIEVSGKPQMFPKWALGFGNTEWGIDEQELRSHINAYRSRHIPLDHYLLDFDWKAWDLNAYGEFEWNVRATATAPDYPGFPSASDTSLKTYLDGQGVELMGITKPRLHVDTPQGAVITAGAPDGALWRNATSVGWWLPSGDPSGFKTDYWGSMRGRSDKVGNLNVFIPAARAWYGKNAIDRAFDKGIVGWWNDEADEGPDADDIPSASNFYNLLLQEGIYSYQRANRPGTRVWSMNRHAYLGAQRYAYGVWSGDISSDWRILKTEAPRMLQTIDAGMARTGTDGGGTAGSDDAVGVIGTGSVNKHIPSAELYARWIQFAAMQPTFRVHGVWKIQRQPWFYGSEAEAAATDAIRLRSTLMPYIYAHDRIYSDTGIPFVRPLVWDSPKDGNVADRVDEWMFGRHLLAAPILDPRGAVTSPDGTQSIAGTTSKSIYLPTGTWYDYVRGTVHAGGASFTYPVSSSSLRDLPLFVKKGAIIPTLTAPLDHVFEKPVTTVRLDMFPDTTVTTFPYYDDDGVSYQYESDSYFRQDVSVQQAGNTVTVTLGAKQGSYVPALQHYLVAIQAFQATSVAGFASFASPAALDAASGEGWALGTGVHGSVTLIKVAAGTARTISATGTTPGLGIATTVLPSATRNAPYDAQLCADGLGATATWTVTPPLPAGLVLDAFSGRITGSPTAASTRSYTFTVASGGTASAALTLAVTAAPLLAYEPFPFTSGAIDWNGRGGENGFAEPWQRLVGGNGQGQDPVYPALYVTGLSASGIATTGGAVELTSVQQVPGNVNSQVNPEYARRLLTGFTDGGALGANAWIGFIGLGTSPGTGFLGVGLYDGTAEKLLIGQRYGASNWGVEVAGGGGGATSTTGLATTAFVVVNIRGQGDGSRAVRMWLDPAPGATPSDASAAVSFTTTTDLSFDTVRLRGDSMVSKLTVDELRVGATYADVCGGTAAVPQLDITRGLAAVADGGVDVVTGTTAGSPSALTYVLHDAGSAALSLTAPVAVSGLTNCTATITTQPSTTIAIGASSDLVVSVTPTVAGAWSFSVAVACSDGDHNPYAWTVSGTASAAQGGLLVAEPFAYDAGSLAGRNGGTGWPSTWDAGANTVAAPGLATAALAGIGNRADVTTASFRSLPGALADGTWWIAFLAQSTTPGTGWGGVSFFDGATEQLFIGQRYGASSWGLEANGSGITSSAGSDKVSLLVVRLVLRAGADDAMLWVDPATDGEPSVASGLAFNAFGELHPDRVRIASGTTVRLDELRIGDSYASVIHGAPAALTVTRAGAAVADGGTDRVPTSAAGVAQPLAYQLTNRGGTALSVTTPVAVSPTSNCSVVTTTQPSGSIAPGATSALIVSVTPAADGAWSFALSVATSDAVAGSYDWSVSGFAGNASSARGGNLSSSGSHRCGLGSAFVVALALGLCVARHTRTRSSR